MGTKRRAPQELPPVAQTARLRWLWRMLLEGFGEAKRVAQEGVDVGNDQDVDVEEHDLRETG